MEYLQIVVSVVLLAVRKSTTLGNLSRTYTADFAHPSSLGRETTQFGLSTNHTLCWTFLNSSHSPLLPCCAFQRHRWASNVFLSPMLNLAIWHASQSHQQTPLQSYSRHNWYKHRGVLLSCWELESSSHLGHGNTSTYISEASNACLLNSNNPLSGGAEPSSQRSLG